MWDGEIALLDARRRAGVGEADDITHSHSGRRAVSAHTGSTAKHLAETTFPVVGLSPGGDPHANDRATI